MISRHIGCVFRRNCIADRAPCTKETLPDFSLIHESRNGGTIGAIYFVNKVSKINLSHTILFCLLHFKQVSYVCFLYSRNVLLQWTYNED